MKQLIWIVLGIFTCLCLKAQIVITGRVVDATTGEPLVAASIITTQQKVVTSTDLNGNYALQLQAPDSIKVLYVGYQPFQQLISSSGSYDIQLNYANQALPTFLVAEKRIGQTYNTPNMANIRLEDLALDNQTNLAPVLNRVAGVLMHNGTFSTNRITIRGIGNRSPFGTNKIRAYLNDIPLTNGVGETTLEDLDWEVFQTADVLRGPTSGLYGAGLGGMIHLKTDLSQTHNQFDVANSIGSYGLQRNTTKLQINIKDHAFRVGLNRTHSNGYRENNEYDRLGAYFYSFWKLKKLRLSSLINYIELKGFIPSSLNFSDYQNNPQKAASIWANIKGFEDYRRTLVGITAEYDLSGNIKNTTTLFGSFYNSYESRPFNILIDTSSLVGVRTTFEWNTTKVQLKLGTEAFSEQYNWRTYSTNNGIQGNLLSDNQEKRKQINLFTQAQIQATTNWTIQLGLGYNFTSYELEDVFFTDTFNRSGNYAFHPILSPYFSSTYAWKIRKNNYKWYVITSYGFSPPTLEETLTPAGAINPDIEPERGWNYETGITANSPYLDWRLAIYTMRIRDLLVARRTDFDQFVGVNAGKTIHQGIELEARAKLLLKKMLWHPFLNYTYSNYTFDTFVDGINDYSGNKLTGTAPHLFTSGLIIHWQSFTGNINFQFTDAMPIRDDNTLFSEAYDLLNMRLDYRFAIAKKWEIAAFGGINNIWDEKYASMLLINANSTGAAQPRYYYPGLPRNYYSGIKLIYRWQS